MKAPAFQFYAQDFLTGVMYLTNEEVGIYIKMLSKQWTDGKIPKKRLGLFVGYDWVNLSEEIKEKFEDKGDYVINTRLEVEREKKSNFLKRQSENGKKGGRPKKDVELKNPNDTQKKPLEEEDEIEDEEEDRIIEIDYKEVQEIFNSVCVNLPKVKKISDKRKKLIDARAKEYDLETIGDVFKKVSKSDFLNGRNGNEWNATFDWIFNPTNFLKILEDNYINKTPVKQKSRDAAVILQERHGY